MSGFEANDAHSAKGSLKTAPDTPSSRGCHFSDHYSLPGQGHSGNTMHSQQKYHSSHQAERTQILDEKHCRRSGVSLSEYVDLPQPRNEQRKVMDDFIHGKIAIREFFLFRKIVIQSGSQFRSTAIDHCRPVKHPLLFRNIVVPNTPCMRIDTGKQPTGQWL